MLTIMLPKKQLIEFLTKTIAAELAAITAAAINTYADATHADSKPENKYDTRGLEASYLAGAQAKRVSEMKEVLAIFENLPIKHFTETQKIMTTALVKIRHNEKITFVLIMPKGGGQTVIIEQQSVQVITPESPLGKALIGKGVGDEFSIELGDRFLEYEVLSLC